MKVFYNNSFQGHWPVGTSAIIIAKNEQEAKIILENKLEVIGLKQEVSLGDLVEVKTNKELAIILQDGEY
jgi:hypothetical protein